MEIIKGGVTAPIGFLASAVSCGIKKSSKNDLALLFSKVPATSAGTFTTNRFRSGSVVLSEMRVKKGIAQAVIVNSGNANSCVGKKEIKDAEEITGLVAKRLNLNTDFVLVASTGIIGRPLEVGKIQAKVGLLINTLSRKNATKFAKAIMTTDTVHKEVAVSLMLGDICVRIGGAVKGSGMLCPNMATMLAFFTTDVSIEKGALKAAFRESVSDSFNKLTVDGDMSTNDTAIIFANGLAGNKVIKKNGSDYFKFLMALKFISAQLARKLVLDGEGATKFVEILVNGAKTSGEAEKVARQIAGSTLVKTMLAGEDPNWGRVAASIGASRVNLSKDRIDIYFGKKIVLKNGTGTGISKRVLSDLFKKREIDIIVDLKSGEKSSRIWTCDLTEEYVRINSKYET